MALDRRISHPREVVSAGDEVDVTIVSVDPVKKRLGLSVVENARKARDAEDAEDRKEAQQVADQLSREGGLGTFADLLKKK